MYYDFLKMVSTYPYTEECNLCGGYFVKSNGKIVIANPPKYPVKCLICGKESHSMLKSEVEAFKNETGTPNKK